MKSILINIVCRKDTEEHKLVDIIDKCYSDNYNVCINICDYTLQNKIKDINIINVDKENKFNIKYRELDIEDVSNHNSKLADFMDDQKYDVFIDIESSIGG